MKTNIKYATPSKFSSGMELPPIPGLRLTRQRSEVFRTLMKKRDHPTAAELFKRVKKSLPTISLATVYNCLETLVKHGIVNQVNFEREPSRFCPNLVDHGHFLDENTEVIHDITLKENVNLADFLNIPEGACITQADFNLKGFIASSLVGNH